MREALLACSDDIDWSQISPAIFGAMFQSVLEDADANTNNKRKASRRELGAHFTSERNILRAINPLFMDGLRAEFEAARNKRDRQKSLTALYDKLPTIRIFDPACGCGNFLVVAYRELRELEHEVIAAIWGENGPELLEISTRIRVNVGQFYGIEIDEAAAHIARVALYITDEQMNHAAEQRFGVSRPTVPIAATPHIRCGNALQTDWSEVLPAEQCGYIVGNPPFIGAKMMSDAQREDATKAVQGPPGFGQGRRCRLRLQGHEGRCAARRFPVCALSGTDRHGAAGRAIGRNRERRRNPQTQTPAAQKGISRRPRLRAPPRVSHNKIHGEQRHSGAGRDPEVHHWIPGQARDDGF